MVQHLEGLGRLLEPDDGNVIARVAVGVILQGQFAIGLGDLFLRCGALDPEDFIIVAFVSHRHHIVAYMPLTREWWICRRSAIFWPN